MAITLEQLKDELSVVATMTKSKTEFQTECLLEVVNNEWRVAAIDSCNSTYNKLEYSVGKKYIKVNQFKVHADNSFSNNGVFMFIDKESGACYKPASHKAPAKGIRFWVEQLVNYPEMVDPYGSFLYVR
mgnify:CR=1 FL=1|jgi:hypothetical protein